MTIATGDQLPAAKLKEKTAEGVIDVDIQEFTKGRKIILFAVPGAFTPTCSNSHLPGFLENRDSFYARGVDEIAVLAVNDHHVMQAWAKATGGEGKIRFLADGNGDFTREIGLLADLSAGGLGLRSKRYSMLVEDGKVVQLNVEDAPGQTVASGAATLLGQL